MAGIYWIIEKSWDRGQTTVGDPTADADDSDFAEKGKERLSFRALGEGEESTVNRVDSSFASLTRNDNPMLSICVHLILSNLRNLRSLLCAETGLMTRS